MAGAGYSLDCYTSGGYLKPRRLSTAGTGSCQSTELMIIRDTDAGNAIKLVYNDPTNGIVSVTLT